MIQHHATESAYNSGLSGLPPSCLTWHWSHEFVFQVAESGCLTARCIAPELASRNASCVESLAGFGTKQLGFMDVHPI